MEEELLFRILFVSIYAAFAAIRIVYRIPSAKKEGGERYALPRVAALTLSLGILAYFGCIILYLLYSPWILWFQIPEHSWIQWFGMSLAILCIPALYWIHHTLGTQYSAELKIQTDHRIILTGPYTRVRHPMYTVFIVFTISMAVLTSNLLILFFSLLISISFPSLAKREEQMLIDTFGDEYREYMRRSGRFLPKLRNSSKDKTSQIS